jgi:hypothetical protein
MPPAPAASSRSPFLGLAAILIALLLGFAGFELWAVRADWAQLSELSREHAADEKRLQQLEQTAKRAEAAASPAAAGDRAAPANADPRAKAQAARAEGQAFARAFLGANPKARAMLVEFQTRNMENYYAPFFRAAGFSQAQIDDFIARTARTHLDSLVLDPNGVWSNGSPNLAPDEFRSVFGDAAYQQWRDSSRALPAENWVGGLAIAVKDGAPALSADQAIALTQIVANNSPDYADGKRVNPQTVDLASVVAQAKGMLTDAQWQQTQNYLTLQAANQQLQVLIKGGQ